MKLIIYTRRSVGPIQSTFAYVLEGINIDSVARLQNKGIPQDILDEIEFDIGEVNEVVVKYIVKDDSYDINMIDVGKVYILRAETCGSYSKTLYRQRISIDDASPEEWNRAYTISLQYKTL